MKGKVGRPSATMLGPKNPNWNGGSRYQHGHVKCLCPNHYRADANGYVQRSILAWEKANGRPFPEGMEPHHKNLVKDDDRPENIEPKTHSKHIRDHNLERSRHART
jgi:hypothetical protein